MAVYPVWGGREGRNSLIFKKKTKKKREELFFIIFALSNRPLEKTFLFSISRLQYDLLFFFKQKGGKFLFLHCFIGTLDPIRQYPPPIFFGTAPFRAARGKREVLFFSLLHLWAWWRFGSSLSERGNKKKKKEELLGSVYTRKRVL